MKPINLFKIKNIAVLNILFSLVALQGCIDDDLSVCGVSLQFEYTKNLDDADRFTAEVNNINLYIFDSEGYFLEKYEREVSSLSNSNTIGLNLMPGIYSMVAWGNLNEDDFDLPELQKGVTSINDAILSLKSVENVVESYSGTMFHGGLYDVKVEGDVQTNQYLTINMMKNTHNITVYAKGLPVTKAGDVFYSCSITSINGDYKFDNSIATSNRLQYIPDSHVDDDRQLISAFTILRELNDGSTQSRLILSRTSTTKSETEQEELLNEDLVQLLLPASVRQNLDIEHDFEITVFYDETNATFSITVNDWEDHEQGSNV